MAKRIISAATLLVMLLSFISCTGGISSIDADIPALIEQGREMEKLVYGDGLEVDPSTKNKLRSVYELVVDEKYSTKQELTDAMEEVFTSSYVGVMCIAAFEGVYVEEGIIRARYIEEDNKLYADCEFVSEIKLRTPDYDSLKTKRANQYMAEVTINMICGDGTVEEALITLKNEDGKWKLDSSVL